MHYHRPAVEARAAMTAHLGRISGGTDDDQPVWRTAKVAVAYERPAIEARTEMKARLGRISGSPDDIGILQPVWRENGDDDPDQ